MKSFNVTNVNCPLTVVDGNIRLNATPSKPQHFGGKLEKSMATVLRPTAPFIAEPADAPIGGLLKRSFDFVFATGVLLMIAPVLLIIGLLIKLRSPGPALFVHDRIGQNGQRFGCLKFRTMHPNSDAQLAALLARDPQAALDYSKDHKLKNDPRVIPKLGHFLRASSLDELPQFINVLKGEMSVIGPRPVTREELETHYGACAADVLRARPGISGLWQVSGRSSLSYDDRVRLDMTYVRDWRFAEDMKILLRTCGVVIGRKGAY